ncbi:N/A [soil metagenome]
MNRMNLRFLLSLLALNIVANLGVAQQVHDENIIPAAGSEVNGTTFVVPQGGTSVTPFVVPPTTPKGGPALPSAPPAPAITMLVLVPQDAPLSQSIPYTIQVTNNSNADAGKVRVRMPLPEGTTLVSAEPQPVQGVNANELIWDLKSIPHNETRKIELKLKAGATVTEVNAKAYVSYEFGQAVKTRLSPQKLKVTTELPKLVTSADEAINVRVRVANDGRVPVENVKLTETISDGFEFHRDSEGEKTGSPLTRTWDLGTIPGGMGKVIDFRVTSKNGRELLVRSNIDAAGNIQISDDAKATVKDAKLKVQLSGDPTASDDTATYKAVVKNDGTMTLTNIRVIGIVPQDCKITSRTNGGQLYQGQVQWVIPKLTAGDSYLVKWTMQSSTAGRKTIRAEAVSSNVRDAQDVQTVFAGAAALNWDLKFEQPTVPVDKTGMFTVKVSNSGSEAAKNVKLVLMLPPEVSFVQATPKFKVDGQKLIFDPRDLKAGTSDTFSITFRGERTGPGYFVSKLTSESLGEKPMTSEKYVQITSGR